MIRTEMRRVFRSKVFWAACAFMVVLLAIGSDDDIRHFLYGSPREGIWQEKFLLTAGYDDGLVPFYCPIVAVLPYVLSYRKERDSGYRQLMVLKTSPNAYRRAKLLSVAASGAGVMCLPFLCWMPVCIFLGTGRVRYPIMSHMIDPVLQPLFESHPNLFVFLYLVNASLAGAVFALLALGVSAVVRNRYLALLAPFGFCLFTAAVLAVHILYNLTAFILVIFGESWWMGLGGHICYLLLLLLFGVGLFLIGDCSAEKQ